jgi:hypothetical protein
MILKNYINYILIIIIIIIIIKQNKLQKQINKIKNIEKFALTNDDEARIRSIIKDIYSTDLDAIRTLAAMSKRIQENGLTVNGDLTVTGNIKVDGNDNKISDIKIQNTSIGANSGYLRFDTDNHIRHFGYNNNTHNQRFATGSLWTNGDDSRDNEFYNKLNTYNEVTLLHGNLWLGKTEYNKWIIHTPQDDRGGLWFSRQNVQGVMDWSSGFAITTNKANDAHVFAITKGGFQVRNTNGTWTHFGYPDGNNYIRNKVIVDGHTRVNGSILTTGCVYRGCEDNNNNQI